VRTEEDEAIGGRRRTGMASTLLPVVMSIMASPNSGLATNATLTTPASPSLQGIPQEIRDAIYHLIDTNPDEAHINIDGQLAEHPLMQTCTQLRQEFGSLWTRSAFKAATTVNLHLTNFLWWKCPSDTNKANTIQCYLEYKTDQTRFIFIHVKLTNTEEFRPKDMVYLSPIVDDISKKSHAHVILRLHADRVRINDPAYKAWLRNLSRMYSQLTKDLSKKPYPLDVSTARARIRVELDILLREV